MNVLDNVVSYDVGGWCCSQTNVDAGHCAAVNLDRARDTQVCIRIAFVFAWTPRGGRGLFVMYEESRMKYTIPLSRTWTRGLYIAFVFAWTPQGWERSVCFVWRTTLTYTDEGGRGVKLVSPPPREHTGYRAGGLLGHHRHGDGLVAGVGHGR
jgi:hypothetical protein